MKVVQLKLKENVSKKIKLYQEQNTLIVKDSFRFWHLINVTDITTRIKIYIPNSYEFNKVELEVDAGELIVPNLKANDVEIDVDAEVLRPKILLHHILK